VVGQQAIDAAQLFALQLHYYRSISRERLVNTSIDEIRRLSATPIPAATLKRWRPCSTPPSSTCATATN
jgi:hypothetical protein